MRVLRDGRLRLKVHMPENPRAFVEEAIYVMGSRMTKRDRRDKKWPVVRWPFEKIYFY